MSTEPEAISAVQEASAPEKNSPSIAQMAAWFGVGVAVAAVGILVGREMRSRYKFNHRTPYDFYENAGDYASGDYGVGV